mgnify:CR=1 FL=1
MATATAYDYRAQRWVQGNAARALRSEQINDELDLLESPSGDAYAAFIACPDRLAHIRELRAELAALAWK